MKKPQPLTLGERLQANREIQEICLSIGEDLAGHIRGKLLLLTPDEIDTLRGPQVTSDERGFYRLARVLVCAYAGERIERQWQAESTKRDTKRVKSWLRNRP